MSDDEQPASDKPLVWLKTQIKTPPLTKDARMEAGTLLRRLQQGEHIGLPHSRSMPAIGARCHELRINDKSKSWRIAYRIDGDAIVIVHVFEKRTQKTPDNGIETCQKRLTAYDDL